MQDHFSTGVGKIVVLGTGGTISARAQTATDNVGYVTGQVSIRELVASAGGLDAASNMIWEQVAQIDSKDMSFALWLVLAKKIAAYLNRPEVRGVVITHGTDTLEETAYFLHLVLPADKPVVLTCAMRPASSPASDGGQNLLDAIAVARHEGACGVTVVCAGTVHSAVKVQKVHTYRLDAFSSGDDGPLAYVEEGSLRMTGNWPKPLDASSHFAILNIADPAPESLWPQVDIVTRCAGSNGTIVSALIGAGTRGLVVAGTGNGTVHGDLESALLVAQAEGVPVVRASRCVSGPVYVPPGDRFENTCGLSPAKARIGLMLRLIAAQPLAS